MRTIRDLQEFLGVAADGIWGPKSKAALDAVLTGEVKPRPEDDSEPRVDARSEAKIETLIPQVRPLARALVRNAKALGITIIVTSGTRTYEEQNELFEQGRSKSGPIVTNARGGYSNHNFGIAFDVTIFSGGQPVWESPLYQKVGEIGRNLGLDWGGDWHSISDEPHFELHPIWAKGESESLLLAELRLRHESGRDVFA